MNRLFKTVLVSFLSLGTLITADVVVLYSVGEKHIYTDWEVIKEATCQEEGQRQKVCTSCGEVIQEAIPKDPENHVFSDWTVVTPSTCIHQGQEQRICPCGASETQNLPLDPERHEFENRYRFDDTYHYYAASCGHDAYKDREEHEFVFQVTKDPSCSQEGEEVGTCQCGYQKTQTIAKLPHTPGEPVKENEVSPTCTKEGSYDEVTYCTFCGEEIEREKKTVPASGHIPGEKHEEDEVDPTCTQDGHYDEVTRCAVCDEELERQTVSLPATGHTPGDTVIENTIVSTCVSQGSHDEVIYCTVCHEELERNTIADPLKEHSFGSWLTVLPSTCTVKGSEERTCSVCGFVESRDLDLDPENHPYYSAYSYDESDHWHASSCSHEVYKDKQAHDFIYHVVEEPTCSRVGKNVGFCSVCGYAVTLDIEKLPHTPASSTVENRVEPTCTNEGYYENVVYCSVCGEEISRERIPLAPLGHVPGEMVVENNVESTCVTQGSHDEVVYCSVCQAEMERKHVLHPLADHTYGEWQVKEASTCYTHGYEERVCSFCQHVDTRELELDEDNHTYSTSYTYDENEHWFASTCPHDLKKDSQAHSYVYHVIDAPTCSHKGREEGICQCGSIVFRDIDKLDHTPGVETIENEVDSTCTSQGSYDVVVRCTVCGEIVSSKTVKKELSPHTYGDWQVITKSTCLSEGLKKRTCAICGFVDTENIPIDPDAHSFESTLSYDENGHYYKSTCGHDVKKDYTPHTFQGWVTITDPTCSKEGEEIGWCICSYSKRRPIEKTSHTPGTTLIENQVASTCAVKGHHDEVTYCIVCGEEVSRATIEDPLLDHSYGAWKTVKSSDCVNAGYQERTCQVCGHNDEQSLDLDPDTHPYDGTYTYDDSHHWQVSTCEHKVIRNYEEHSLTWAVTKTPSCTQTGQRVGKCSCGYTITEALDKESHTISDDVIENVVLPTCTEEGHHDIVHYCTVCNAELDRTTIVDAALGHLDGDPVSENKKEATCITSGQHDEVTYCTRCHTETSRTTVIDAPPGDHTPDLIIVRNKKSPTCTEDGSHDDCYYCSVCHKFIKTVHVIDEKLGHSAGQTEEEIIEFPTCTEAGSHDEVVYCSRCGEEMSRTTIVDPAIGHDADEAVKENITTEGYDLVVYCKTCGEEISRTHVSLSQP